MEQAIIKSPQFNTEVSVYFFPERHFCAMTGTLYVHGSMWPDEKSSNVWCIGSATVTCFILLVSHLYIIVVNC